MKLGNKESLNLLDDVNHIMSELAEKYGLTANNTIDVLVNYLSLLVFVVKEKGQVSEDINNEIAAESVKRTILLYLQRYDEDNATTGKFVHPPVDKLH